MGNMSVASQEKNIENGADRTGIDCSDIINKEIGRRLKAFRTSLDKTQADFADILDISPQQYQKYEKGTSRCSISSIYQLAEYFETAAITLLPPQFHAKKNSGFSENNLSFATRPGNTYLNDEAEAMAELLSVFARIPTRSMRKKLISLLNTMYE